MFRPNRIGTPKILQGDQVPDVSSFTVSNQLISSAAWNVNVINATPVLDFGRSAVYWVGSARTLNASSKMAFGQQFTVTQPLGGDVRGVELNGSLQGNFGSGVSAQAFLAKQIAAGTTLFEVEVFNSPVMLKNDPHQNNNVGINRSWTYTDQAVIYGDRTTLPGTYVHGFIIWESQTSPSNQTFTQLYASMSVRQLNDQQGVGYADTLR